MTSALANSTHCPRSVTAWLATETLGGDYRFKTRFHPDDNRVLYVRGGGDSFDLRGVGAARDRVGRGNRQGADHRHRARRELVPPDLRVPGIEHTDEAYNALNSALGKLNTINAARKGNTVRSAEKQTPITPLAISQFRAGPSGSRPHQPRPKPTVSLQYAFLLTHLLGGLGKGEDNDRRRA